MSQSNIEIVQRFFEARNRGDQSYFDYLDPDAELDLLESCGPYRGLYRGHDEIRRHRDSRDEAWATVEWHLEEPVAVGATLVGDAVGKGILTRAGHRPFGDPQRNPFAPSNGDRIWSAD